PAQLAIPVALPAGTRVFFLRYGSLPDASGTWKPIWLQVESGVVDPNGMARTASPPYSGVNDSGDYVVAKAVATQGEGGPLIQIVGQLVFDLNMPLASIGVIPFDPLAQGSGAIGALANLSLIGPIGLVPFLSASVSTSKLTIIAVPRVGLPIVNTV